MKKLLIYQLREINQSIFLVTVIFEEPPTGEFLNRVVELSGITESQLGWGLRKWDIFSKSVSPISDGKDIKDMVDSFDLESGKLNTSRDVFGRKKLGNHQKELGDVLGFFLTYHPK